MSKKKALNSVAPAEVPDWIPTLHFEFTSKGAKAPQNFDNLSLEDTVKVTTIGKIQSLNQHSGGKSFSITMDKVKLVVVDGKAGSMSDAMASAQKDRTL